MAPLRSLFVTTIVLLCCSTLGTADVAAIQPRQASTGSSPPASSAPPPASSAPPPASSAPTSQEQSLTQTHIQSSGGPHSIKTTHHASSTHHHSSSIPVITSIANTISVASGIAPTPSPTATNGTASQDPQLPIQPSITPGLGFAGAIFLITGTIYTLVGIRNRWLYIFLGSAYLTSLAVTVLIVYVATPPVSDAIQGAYFVAAFATGVLLGGLSLVFTEITECLGCIFGGFCLAMWFLCLKSGGLLTSTGGRVALIASLCIVLTGLSFSRHTKTYATIGSSSFAGATVLVLGVDCFSRAGLKEFWLYVWGLNQSLFPMNTKTYPVTRGVQAETACIVIVFLFGLMSQAKLWKVVRQKQNDRDAERLQGEREQDKLESTLGRRIETITNRERARWEAIYDQSAAGKSTSDYQSTTSASMRKNSTSTREHKSANDSVEMVDLEAIRTGSQVALVQNAGSSNEKPSLTVRVADDSNDVGYMNQRLNRTIDSQDPSPATSRLPSARNSWGRDAPTPQPVSILKNRNTASPSPALVPLPFAVPANEQDHDDAHSMATIAETDDSAYEERHSRENLRKPNPRRVPEPLNPETEEEFAVDIPHIEDDRASSVAATLDDLTDDESASLPHLSPHSLAFDDADADDIGLQKVPSQLSLNDVGSNAGSGVKDSKDFFNTTRSSIEEPRDTQPRKKSVEISNSKRKRMSINSSKRRSIQSMTATELSEVGTNGDAVKRQLSAKVSKVAMSYRTNEWAKHLEAAERPDLDDLSIPPVPAVPSDRGVEIAAPVNIEDLQQTAKVSEIGITSRTNSLVSNTNPYRGPVVERSVSDPIMHQVQPTMPASRSSSAASYYTPAGIQRTDSQSMQRLPATNLIRSTSQPNMIATRGLRSGSTPILAQTLVESPIEEAAAEHERAPSRANTIGSRMGSAYTPANPNIYVMPPGDAASMHSARFDDDNMSLSSRKRMIDADNQSLAQQRAFLQQQQMQHAQQMQLIQAARQTTWPLQQNHIHDSHQPQRGTALRDNAKREAMLATWRASVQQEMAPGQVKLPDEARRQAMLNERRQTQFQQQQQAAAINYRDNVFDSMMRRGDILDLHQEAMRRMQSQAAAQANRGL